jgi:phosphatidate cytidylyltransferase
MLKYRILTAMVLIPLVIVAIFLFSQTAFSLACAGVILLGAWEWGRLCGLQQSWQNIVYLCVVVIALIIANQVPFIWVLMIGTLWWMFASLWLLFYPRGEGFWRYRGVRYGIGLLILVPTWVALTSLQSEFANLGPWYVLFMLLIIWAMDSGSYFTGRCWGKTHFAPVISPKKTVQGLYGGFVIVGLVDVGIIMSFHLSLHHAMLVLVISLVTAVVAVLGDLVESMFKRYQNVKDSGTILPGHGGILDRIDSLTAVAPVYALMITLIELHGLPF